MKIKRYLLFLSLLPALIFAACTVAPQTVEVTRIFPHSLEVTRIVPQTVEVTRVIPQTVIITQTVQITPTHIVRTPLPVEIKTKPDQNTAYYDCVIVLTEYYTLLDLKLYEQAYQLLSTSRPKAVNLEEFINAQQMFPVDTYKLVSAQPYYEFVKVQGQKPFTDLETKKLFIVHVYVEGEKGWAGFGNNGVHTLFVTLAWGNGQWKIYKISGSPK